MSLDSSSKAQEIITDEAFNDFLCQGVSVTLGLTGQGQSKSLLPTLVVLEQYKNGTHPVTIFLLEVEDFNDGGVRRKALQDLGRSAWVDHGLVVVACFFCTEAWVRQERPEAGKQISDYDDKKEVIIIQGKTMDGRSGLARAEIVRDVNDFIHTGTPNVLPIGAANLHTYALDSFLASYAQAFMADHKGADSN